MNKKEDLIDKLIHMRIKEGKTRQEIFAYLRDELGYAKQTAYEYMKWSREETEERSLQLFGKDLGEDIDRFENLYSQAMKDGNYKLAKEHLIEISKLKGHYIERKDVTTGGKPIDEIKIIHIKTNRIDDDSESGIDFFGLDTID